MKDILQSLRHLDAWDLAGAAAVSLFVGLIFVLMLAAGGGH